jgi:hypothetical protein
MTSDRTAPADTADRDARRRERANAPHRFIGQAARRRSHWCCICGRYASHPVHTGPPPPDTAAP